MMNKLGLHTMGTNPQSTSVATPASPADPSQLARQDLNVVLVAGQLVNEPERRTLPSGSEALSFSLTVRVPGEKTTSIPAVWYDPPTRVDRWVPGDQLVVMGAVVRRFFRTGAGLGSATEVVVDRCELGRHQAKSASVRARAAAVLHVE